MGTPGEMSVPEGLIVDSRPEFFTSCSHEEALEDVEHPAWISTTSFSESCGSYLSRISSLCLEAKESDFSESADCRVVPEHSQENGNMQENSCSPVPATTFHFDEAGGIPKLGDIAFVYQEDRNPFTASGSLQSLSSSSKTIYASPRSNSGSQFYSRNKSLAGRAIQTRGNLYRERAPSENALDFRNLNSVRECKLSQSLHDVSSIPSNGLKKPVRKSAGASLSTLCLRNRSRDSGFIQSESLLSLSSGSRNYDHVESKVKRYIQDIKDADAARRKERARNRVTSVNDPKQPLENDYFESQDSSILLKMQQDLEEKDRLLSKLQEDYNRLLGKYAEAENRIDKFRFGWYESSPSAAQRPFLSPPKNQTKNNNLKHFVQTSPLAEMDNCSLSSSMFLSNFEDFDSPDSSFDIRRGMKNVKQNERKPNEVIVSAPLRPIASLYCTSVRLDRVMAPLHSKSSVDEQSMSSSHDQCNEPNENKPIIDDGLPELTILEGTTDTGIDTFCPLSVEGLSTTHHPSKAIGHLPHEDPMLKVQRWQKSIPTPTRPHPKFSPFSKSSSRKRTQLPDNSFEMVVQQQKDQVSEQNANKKNYSSIGIQVNEGDSLDLPSTISRMSTPMVPCLNLGELSGCTDEFSGSLLSSECGKNKSTGHLPSESHPSSKVHSDSHSSMPSKSFSSNIEISTSTKQMHEGKCKSCGSNLKSREKHVSSKRKEERNNQFSSAEKLELLRNHVPLSSRKEKVQKSISQLSGSDLAQLVSMIWKDQDHVVPTSPEEEKSYQHAFETLERKMNSLKNSVNLQTFVSLLDVLLEKAPTTGCICHHDHSVPNSGNTTGLLSSPAQEASVLPDCSDVDGSLLQCLEELDQYTHQVWAKTESFLEVLNSDKCSTSLRPQ